MSDIVLPATFPPIHNFRALDDIGKAGEFVFGADQNVPSL